MGISRGLTSYLLCVVNVYLPKVAYSCMSAVFRCRIAYVPGYIEW